MQHAVTLWSKLTRGLSYLQSPLMLLIRGYWGYQFAVTGWGKLQHIERVASWFDSLGIPAPELNAYMAGTTELVGGIALLLGLGARIASVPLIVTMTVAYLTADFDALSQIFSNPDAFVTATPFLFLLASVLVLVHGPGVVSLDHLIARSRKRKATHDKAPASVRAAA